MGAPERVEEDRVEVLVRSDSDDRTAVSRVIEELKKVACLLFVRDGKDVNAHQVHPYEEVAYDVYRLEDF